MSISILLTIFIALALASIFIVRVLDGRIVRKRVMNSRAIQLLQKAKELNDAAFITMPLFSSNTIPQVLLDEQIDLLHDVLQLSDKSTTRDAITIVKSQKEELAEKSFTQNRALTSDASIARHSVFLNEAGVVILKRHKKNKISEEQFHEYIEELSWAKLMINVVPLITQSNQLRRDENPLKAEIFLKKALKKTESSSLSDKRKNELITELKAFIAGERQSLPVHLIPELSQ